MPREFYPEWAEIVEKHINDDEKHKAIQHLRRAGEIYAKVLTDNTRLRSKLAQTIELSTKAETPENKD